MVPRMIWVSRHSGKQSLFRHHRSGCVLRASALFLRDDRSPGQALVGGSRGWVGEEVGGGWGHLSAPQPAVARSLGCAHDACFHQLG